MRRISFLGVALLTTLAGCGGGGGGVLSRLVATNGTGQVGTVQFGPPAGTSFVGRSQVFQMGWTTAAPPPPLVEVSLFRYQEARGGEARAVVGQRLGVLPAAGALTWDIRPNSLLAADGVYFLELTTTGQGTRRACFLVGSSPNPTGTGVTLNTGTTSGQLGSVQISTAGQVYLPRTSAIQLTWAGAATPPPSFTATLWRYREARGLLGRSVEEQALAEPVRTGSSFVWTLRRRDGAELDLGGVYFLELRAPGQTDVRSAFIVSTEQ